MEFKSFGEIKHWRPLFMTITQKINGSNAQIVVFKTEDGSLDAVAGSRTKFLSPGRETDNFGFAQYVADNKAEIIEKLGEGTHYGEWTGFKINSGEGLKDRILVLFNHAREYPAGLPKGMVLVPVLYSGKPVDVDAVIDEVMEDLKTNGSKLVPGFMRTEGVVIEVNGQRRKKLFEAEETKWKGPSKPKKDQSAKREAKDYSHLLQPIRLEKLLSRDESYQRDYPKTLGAIVKAYTEDLEKEGQLPSDPDELRETRKAASGQIFNFVKTWMNEAIKVG